MIKFLSILSRYEAAEFSQLEAAELLGAGERTFRRWRQRHEDAGGCPASRPAAGQARLAAPTRATHGLGERFG
ncbi:MAG: helix-turn-helix domain-containing protein [Methylocella sp.]